MAFLPSNESCPENNSPADVPKGADQLFLAARSGSNSALGNLLQLYRDYLLLVAQRELPDDIRQKVSASDIVQESLAEGVEDFRDFDGNDSRNLQAWLTTILRSNLVDAIRRYRLAAKRDVRREQPLGGEGWQEEHAGQLVARQPSPRSDVLLQEKRALVLAKIEKLDEADRVIIALRNFELLTFEQIGPRLGISADAARKRWQRAIERLSVSLAPLQDSSIVEANGQS